MLNSRSNSLRMCQEVRIHRFGRSVPIRSTLKTCGMYMNKRGGDMGILKRIRNLFPKNRRKLTPYFKRQYSKNREQYRKHQLKYKYGITIADYNLMLNRQGGTCAICNEKNFTREKGTHNNKAVPMSLAVDHNHKTGQVRGLLCNGCNTSLGKFKDDPVLLEKAIQYLKATDGG